MPEYTGFARKKMVREGPAAAIARAAYVELGVASPFSFLRGASDAIELVLTALELGMDAIGIADRNTLAGVVRMHSACKGAGLRPLIGCRLDLTERPSTSLGTNGNRALPPTPFVSSPSTPPAASLRTNCVETRGEERSSTSLGTNGLGAFSPRRDCPTPSALRASSPPAGGRGGFITRG